MYAEEYQSAKEKSIPTSLISFEELKRGNIDSALKRVTHSTEKEVTIYRGWMMKPSLYSKFYDALLKKNIELINNPNEYKFCHYLPENYEAIKAFTPKTTFKKLEDSFCIADFEEQLEPFEGNSVILKDFVKSQKHYWEEACFIPDASDRKKVASVVRKFIELQGEDLNEGLVFREFIELEQLTNHSKSGMPLTKEFRLFILNGKVMSVFNYWDEGDYGNIQPDLAPFIHLIPKIGSNFFTMDIAKKKNGEWLIVELGDGQVAGLPENADKNAFYERLKEA